MDAATREQYLSAQIFTASPERLHLMLIDGAIRFATQLKTALAADDNEAATTVGERCRNVLGEMLLCVERDGNDAAKRLRSIYTFLIREVADAQIRRQSERIDGVLDVLAIERDTWADLCEKLGPREFRRDTEHADAALPTFEPPALPIESFSVRA
ncbi:MAG: flagellar export chaperone FliS [Pirellulales bacterium]